MKGIRVTVKDLETNAQRTAQFPHWSRWDWTDGNWQCDCNRASLFGIEDHPCGETRFVVVGVSPPDDLKMFNQHYPHPWGFGD